MTDDKTPEENPIAGQYTFFPAQDALDGTAEQEAQEASRRIYIVTTPDPGGDPTAPDFDPVAYKESIGQATERVKTALDDSFKRVAENLLNETGMGTLRELAAEISKQAIEGVNQAGKLAVDALSAYFKSAEFDAIKSLARAASEAIALQRERYEALTDRQKDLAPFLEDELLADPNLANIGVYEALEQGLDDAGNPKDGPLKEVIERALTKLAEYEESVKMIDSSALFVEARQAKQPRDKRSKAVEKGALMSMGGRLASYSAKGFENALNTPSIFKLPEERKDIAAIFNEHGQLNIVAMQGSKLQTLPDVHSAFLMALNQIAIIAAHNGLSSDTSGLMTVYLPQFCREIGLDPRKYSKLREGTEGLPLDKLRFAAVLELLRPLEAYVGRTPDGAYWRLAAFHSYDPESDTLTFSAPYLYELRKAEALQQGKALNQLLHGSVVNEPNRAAVELANRILDGLLQRGTRPDYATYRNKPPVKKETVKTTKADGSKETRITVYENQEQAAPAPAEPIVTYQVKFKNLIRDCPQFRRELEDILAGKQIDPRTGQESKSKPAAAYNMKLKHTFEAAIKIILTKSDAPAYFVDLDINPKHPKTGGFAAPTKSALAHDLTITHKGKNPAFRPQEQ